MLDSVDAMIVVLAEETLAFDGLVAALDVATELEDTTLFDEVAVLDETTTELEDALLDELVAALLEEATLLEESAVTVNVPTLLVSGDPPTVLVVYTNVPTAVGAPLNVTVCAALSIVARIPAGNPVTLTVVAPVHEKEKLTILEPTTIVCDEPPPPCLTRLVATLVTPYPAATMFA